MANSHGHDHGHDHHGHDHHGHAHDDVGGPPITAEDLHDPAQESLVRALQSSFNVLRWLMIGLIVAYVFSGVFQVQPGEQGLLARFGKLRAGGDGSPIFQPGWHAALPDPFDEKILISGKQQQIEIESFLFERRAEDRGKPLSEALPMSQMLRPGYDGAMLSGDKNLSHGLWIVQYRISDAALFVENLTDSPARFEGLLRRLTERAVVRNVASKQVGDILAGAGEVRAQVRRQLQDELTALGAGVTIDDVIVRTIEPLQVRDAFRMAAIADNQKQTQLGEARKLETEKLTKAAGAGHAELTSLIREYGAAQTRSAPAAEQLALANQIDAKLDEIKAASGGEVATMLRAADGRANALQEKIRAEVEELNFYLPLYQADPRLAMLRIWVQMRETVLGAKENELMYLPQAGETQIVINTDPQRKIDRELEDYKRRSGGQPAPPR